jgi:glycerate 2-kinase
LGKGESKPGCGNHFEVRILIAPDKFKGSLSARDVAENIASGLQEVLPDAKIDILPLADGGEGTVEVICAAIGGSWVHCPAHDPLGREIDARYAWSDRRKLVAMEMSEAAGMWRVAERERDPLRANTFGVGEMIVGALARGPREMIIGLGGSATNDGGFGMARALGYEFLCGPGNAKLDGFKPSSLRELERIRKPRDLRLPQIIAAVDVKNPLLRENGATRVYGPQKGADEEQLDILEKALTRLAEVVAKDLGVDFRDQPGAGAAGGLGFGLMSFCGAQVQPGFDVVAEAVDLEGKMKDVDVVITGEGKLDGQTLSGKTPAGVARMAQKLGTRVFAIVGCVSADREARRIFEAVYELGGEISEAKELLKERAGELADRLKNTFNAQRPITAT